MLTPDQIAQATHASPDNISIVWPLVVKALKDWEIYSPSTEIAAAATIGVETPNFWPIVEKHASNLSANDYFIKMYWTNPHVRHMLGNLTPKDAYTFFGRGLIQITGLDNYALYGDLCHLDLVGNPDLALVPDNAAQILAAFFSRHSIQKAADDGQWKIIRIRVNGGLNGWPDFARIAKALGANVIS